MNETVQEVFFAVINKNFLIYFFYNLRGILRYFCKFNIIIMVSSRSVGDHQFKNTYTYFKIKQPLAEIKRDNFQSRLHTLKMSHKSCPSEVNTEVSSNRLWPVILRVHKR